MSKPVLKEYRPTIKISAEDMESFKENLENPPEPCQNLIQAHGIMFDEQLVEKYLQRHFAKLKELFDK